MAQYQLLLPKMGESVAEATVIKWVKKPGDYIETDEAVMEIATDKVDSEVPSPVSGTLVEQLFKENDVVQVGSVIALIEVAAHETVSQPVPETSPIQQATVAAEVPQQQFVVENYQQNNHIAENVSTGAAIEATVAEHINAIPGISQLPQNDTPVETPKVLKNANRFYSPLVKSIATQENVTPEELDAIPGTGAEGRLTKDDLIRYIQQRHAAAAKPAETKTIPEAPAQTEQAATAPAPESEPIRKQQIEAPAGHSDGAMHAEKNEPAAEGQMTVHEHSVQTEDKVQMTEKLHEEAVQAAMQAHPEEDVVPEAEPAAESAGNEVTANAAVTEETKQETPPQRAEIKEEKSEAASPVSGGDEIIEMDRMRRLIAEHMVFSVQTSPHVTSFVEADVTQLVAWREKHKQSFEKQTGEKITFTPMFIEAVVKAIIDMPMINVSVNGTKIIKKRDINIGMATALPSGNLIVPVIKRASELNLVGLTRSVNDLAGRARNGKLLPDDVRDGTFTITNVGTFGNLMGTPIINQPQVAILAVGAIKKKPAVIETPEGDFIGIRQMMFLSLSYDHRVVDGAMGGTFLRKVADYLEGWDINRSI